MKFNKLTSALMVFAAVGVAALPVSSAFAAPDAAKIAERKARKLRLSAKRLVKQSVKLMSCMARIKSVKHWHY